MVCDGVCGHARRVCVYVLVGRRCVWQSALVLFHAWLRIREAACLAEACLPLSACCGLGKRTDALPPPPHTHPSPLSLSLTRPGRTQTEVLPW